LSDAAASEEEEEEEEEERLRNLTAHKLCVFALSAHSPTYLRSVRSPSIGPTVPLLFKHY